MSIGEQFNKLKSIKLLPLRLRQFQNLVFFIFSLVKSNRMNSLLETINSFKKQRVTRNVFKEPISNTNLYKYSFISISVKLLNNFIFQNLGLSDVNFRNTFETSIYIIYKNCSRYWT